MGELEAMNYETQWKVLETLTDIQRTTMPIEISIGYVMDNTMQQGILIKSAPAIVTEKLVSEGYCLDITPKGVIVSSIPAN